MDNWTVDKAGVKLVDFLYHKLNQHYSLRKIKSAIEGNHCRVNGSAERFYTHKLLKGDKVQFDTAVLDSSDQTLSIIDTSRVLFEDDHLLIYNKPSAIASDSKELKQLFPSYLIVHRLDKETTGCLMFAKYAKVKNRMIALFKEKKVFKSYLALVDGTPKQRRGIEENFIGKISRPHDALKMGVVGPSKGLHARTEWMLEKRGKKASLLKLFPITGRTHQLRVHCSHMGHPILGDYRYCRSFKSGYYAKRTLLHAYTLTLPHPVTEQMVEVRAPIPKDLKLAIRQECQ